jgi:hypothetical protein
MQPKHDVAALETRLRAVHAQLAKVADPNDTEELFVWWHQPGYTTPAEWAMLMTLVEQFERQTETLAAVKQGFIAGGRAVQPA